MHACNLSAPIRMSIAALSILADALFLIWTLAWLAAPFILASQGLEWRNPYSPLAVPIWVVTQTTFQVVYFLMVVALAKGQPVAKRAWLVALAGCIAAAGDEGYDFIAHPPDFGPIYGTIFIPFVSATALLWLTRPKTAFKRMKRSPEAEGISA